MNDETQMGERITRKDCKRAKAERGVSIIGKYEIFDIGGFDSQFYAVRCIYV